MLLDAVARGRLYQVKFLLELKTVKTDVTDQNGQTLLMKAILLGDKMHCTRYRLVRLLLSHGAKVNATDKDGRTALMYAAILGYRDIVDKILKNSIMDLDLNAGDNIGNTALIYAAARGHETIVSAIITALKRFGLEVDKKNKEGLTALLVATRYGHGRCAQVLLVEGDASLTIRDPVCYMNARDWAVHNGLECFVDLIKTKQEALESKAQKSKSRDDAAVKSENPGVHLDDREKDAGNSRPVTPRGVSKRPGTSRDLSERPVSRRENLDRPMTPREKSKRLVTRRENLDRPETPREMSKRMVSNWEVSSKPVSTKTSKNTLTVPKIIQSLRHTREGDLSAETERFTKQTNCNPPVHENEVKRGKESTSDVSSSSSASLSRRKSPKLCLRNSATGQQSPSAKAEVQRLLSLYGVQNSVGYRRGYDPSLLPPSGMWPDPLDFSGDFSNSMENLNWFDRESECFGDLRSSSRRPTVSEAQLLKRMSVVGGVSRRVGGAGCGAERRTSVGRKAGPPPVRSMQELMVKKPGDRKMSLVARPNMDRPAPLRRINTSISPLVT